jgi:hypothetical protein
MADEFRVVSRSKIDKALLSNTVDASRAAITTTSTERKNRKKQRSADLIEAVRQIDVQADPAMKQAIMDWVQAEYDSRGGGILVGLFSKCYLGHPYVDHKMDIAGTIIEHYRLDQNVPPPFAGARSLAASGAYAFIEVYADGEVIPVRNDGTV